MSYLHEKLDGLYTERADLLEQIRVKKADPRTAEKVKESVFQSRRRMASADETMAALMMSAMPAKLEIERLEAEVKWVEKQIVAILGNPALADE